MDKIRLVIIDDHSIFREGVASIFDSEPDVEIVGQGVTADETIHITRDLLPDVIAWWWTKSSRDNFNCFPCSKDYYINWLGR